MRSGGRLVRFCRKGSREEGLTLGLWTLSLRLGLGKDDVNGLAWYEGTGLGKDDKIGLNSGEEQGLMTEDAPATSGGCVGGLHPFR